MPHPIATSAEVRSRLDSGRFWPRLLLGLLVGHIAGAFGFAATFATYYQASTLGRTLAGPSALAWWHHLPSLVLQPVITTASMFTFAVVLMTPLSIVASPAAVVAAVVLRTNRWWTMLLGAVVGVTIGWPVSQVIYAGLISPEWTWAACSAGAGALFALSVWHFSIRAFISLDGATEESNSSERRKLRLYPVLAVASLILIGLMTGV